MHSIEVWTEHLFTQYVWTRTSNFPRAGHNAVICCDMLLKLLQA